jgi:tol-pal system protein YbgF
MDRMTHPRILIGIALLVAPVILMAPAQAQNSDFRELINRIERMQGELSTLQQTVYKGRPPPPAAPGRGGAGGIDRRVTARIEVRLSQLENELRRMTGKAEELEHAVGQFNARLDKLVSDVDLRLTALERRQGIGAGATGPDGMPAPPPPGPGGVSAASTAGTTTPDAPARSLGTVSARELAANRAAVQAAPPPILPNGTPREQYDFATSLLLTDQNIEKAEIALRAFLDKHPKHRLSSNAFYWLGETFYVRRNFQQAVHIFAEGYQKFPKSGKAADNLLKLGMALGQLKQNKKACTAYASLLSYFPKASRTLKNRVGREQRRLKCR